MQSTIGGRVHHWEESGDREGVPVVLLHGIPTSPALWRHVTPRLKGVHVYAWEMLGYGSSMEVDADEDLGLAAQARYLVEWMDDQGIEAAILAGHDLGGGVAQILATEEPERCLGLFLTNAVSYDSWPIPSVRMMQAMAPVVEKFPEAMLRMVLESFILRGHDDRDVGRESIGMHVPRYMHEDGPAAFARQISALRTEDTLEVAPRLPDLDVPARIVWGAADQFQHVEYGRRLAQDLDAELVEIPAGLHFTPEDHPQIVADGILAVSRMAGPHETEPSIHS